jgi:hypothetical protein
LSLLNSNSVWKLLLVTGLLMSAVGLYRLVNLDVDISGDGIPNRPQREPPVEYPWDEAIRIGVMVVLSVALALYSWSRISR